MKELAILEKELREALKNKLLLFTIGLPPLIFAGFPVMVLYLAGSDPMSPQELEALYRLEPGLRGLDAVTATQVLLVNQMNLYFLMIPAMVPLVIASFSIIGEKQARSLEPLLATPVRVREILVGKCLAAVIPAVLATWAGYALALLGVFILGTDLTWRAAFNPTWVLALAVLAPTLSVTSVGLALIISSRVNDTRVAQQASVILILPILGLFIGQMAGWVLLDINLVLLVSLALLLVNAVLLWLAVKLFRREAILTSWR